MILTSEINCVIIKTKTRTEEKIMQETNKKNTQKEWKPRGFFTVSDFMSVGLGLKGCELLTFALIYSFANLGDEFRGTRKYISAMTGLSVRSVERALASLIERKFIRSVGRIGGSNLNSKYEVNIDRLCYELEKIGWTDSDEEEALTGRPICNERIRKSYYNHYKKRCPSEKRNG